MRNYFIYFILAMSLCLIGCEGQQAKQELERLRAEITQKDEQIVMLGKRLATTEEELAKAQKLIKDTLEAPEKRFQEIQAHIEAGHYDQAMPLLSNYLSEFPSSRHATNVKELQRKLPQLIADQKKAAEEKARILREGFKTIKVQSTFTCPNNTKIHCKKFQSGKKFIFDRRDSRYYYYTADKNNIYISADISVTSKDSNPLLPAIFVGKVNNEGKLTDINIMQYMFYHWESYASYLGNEGDNGNDFSKTDTVLFSIGVEVQDKKGIYVIFTEGTPYFARQYEQFKNPPVYYTLDPSQPFPIPESSLSIEDFIAKYTALAIITR